MAAFKFRLEPVVSLKKQQEDLRKTALAQAKEELKRKEAALVNLCEHREDCERMLTTEMQVGCLDISRKLVFYAYLERLADEIANHREEVARKADDVEVKRQLLLESSKEKKTLEKLKQRMRERYIRQLKKMEQAALDETAAQMHRRNDSRLIWKKEK